MPLFQLEINGRRFEVDAPTREEAIRVANEFAVQPRPGGGPVTGAPTAPGFDPVPVTAPEPAAERTLFAPWMESLIRGGADFGREMGLGAMEGVAAVLPAGSTPQDVAPPFSPLPDTTAGQFGRTIGNFGVGALLGPGAFAPGNVMRYGVVPGTITEGLGQIFDEFGSEAGAYARVATAILATGGAALTGHAGISVGAPRSQAGAAQLIGRALRDARVTSAEVDMAENFMNEALSVGVPITWPEAFSIVTDGRVDLTAMMRFVEQTATGQPITAEFMAARPPAIRRAVEAETATLGPLTPPSVVGPQIQRTAERQISGAREDINAMTDDLYRSSAGTPVDPAEFQALMADPLFVQTLNSIRGDATYGRLIEGFPDNSIAVVDAVKKRLAENPVSQRGQPTAESIRGSVAAQARAAGIGASTDYENALATQSFARENWLAPLENGPLGAMAGTSDLAAQLRAVFPTNPLAGTESEVRMALGLISEASPDAAQAIVRHHLENVFNEAAQNLAAGPNQVAGARFVATIQGNEQQQRNLRAAFEAVYPDSAERWAALQSLMRVLEATGRRLPPSSPTASLTAAGQTIREAGTPLGRLATSLPNPLSILGAPKQAYERFLTRRNGAAMADILTNPAMGDVMRRLASGGPVGDLMAVVGELIFGQGPQMTADFGQRQSIADTVAGFAP